jgi:hypothetical protein
MRRERGVAMYNAHVRHESEDEFADREEHLHNRYLLEKIKETETDTILLGHEDVWRKLGEK